MKIFVTLCCLIGLLEAHEHAEFEWTEKKSEYAQIQVSVAGPGVIETVTHASSCIVSHPDHLAYVIPKAQGVVYACKKNVGDSVEKGDVLVILESQEVAEVKTHYLQSLSRLELRQEILAREESLRGISAKRDYLEAKAAYQEAEGAHECARQNVLGLGLTEQEVKNEPRHMRRFYALKAPLHGQVFKRNLALGEYADDRKKAFVVGNFEKVWVEMHVHQDDVEHLKEGQKVLITGANGNEQRVCVDQFCPQICDKTRTARVLAVLENPSGQWQPGQYVQASILVSSVAKSLVVPKEAVQTMDGEQYLFVKCGEGFEPCRVVTGESDGSKIEIISGLKAGTQFVSCNAFCLKADFEKEEVEHSH